MGDQQPCSSNTQRSTPLKRKSSEMMLAPPSKTSTPVKLNLSQATDGLLKEYRLLLAKDMKVCKEEQKRHCLPTFPCISSLSKDFSRYEFNLFKSLKESNKADPQSEDRYNLSKAFAATITSTFDSVIRGELLYKSEYAQYEELKKTANFKPSETYGFIHLLRLLITLPKIFEECKTSTPLSKKMMSTGLDIFINFLNDNSQTLLSINADYEKPEPTNVE